MDDEYTGEDRPDEEGELDPDDELMLQQGRGHAFAEEFASKPPSISPQLQWWLDRIRGGE